MPERRHAARRPARPSLRRRLLTFLLVPVLGVLVVDAVVGYFIALAYSNRVHDSDLSDSALTLAEMIGSDALRGELTAQARFLLEYDPDGRNYYEVISDRHGLIIGNAELAVPSRDPVDVDAAPLLYDTELGHKALRAAVMRVANRHDAGDTITIKVAENLRDRHQRAREILLLTMPMQALLIIAVLSLVWFGVSHGLGVLEPLTTRLSRRGHDLGPIGDEDVPVEILPLTRTIDDLFARMRNMLGLQERFIADAAHQLRTPLAGIQLHVERAGTADPAQQREAFAHVHRLAARAARTSAQLLALTRTQSPDLPDHDGMAVIDLSQVVPEAVGMRVYQALSLGVDLGYEGADGPCLVRGDALQVQEVIDNLVDNAFHYAGRGHSVTVSVACEGDDAVLAVDDDGPGVGDAFLDQLGERFFRVPGVDEDGTGLGLAIVESIAERHAARVGFSRSAMGGLRVELRLPRIPGAA